MTAFWKKYFALRRRNARIAWDRAKHMKFCYAFLAPYALLFLTFYILPMLISIYYSFTYNNILEPARFIGMDNYITLILKDDVFLTAVKNTFLLAVITGPVGYIMSFCFAWLINELPRWVRTIAVVIFYAPSIAGNAYYIFSIIFRDTNWPSARKIRMGATQLKMLTSREVCSISVPVVETPAFNSRCTRSSSGTMAVL